MDFKQYCRLKRLVLSVSSFNRFIDECSSWHRYAVTYPKIWTKADYQWFYDKIKGGHNYVTLFSSKAH